MFTDFFSIVDNAKLGSCDKHTKLGAIVIDVDEKVLIESCNTMPEGISITEERLERPIKYQYIEHAERNAVFYAARHGIKLEGTILCVNCNPVPCTECARAVIQSGIKMIIGRDIKNMASERWDESCKFALDMLKEAGVVVVYVNDKREFRIIGSISDTYKKILLNF